MHRGKGGGLRDRGKREKIRGVQEEGTPKFFSPAVSFPSPSYALSLGQSRHTKKLNTQEADTSLNSTRI